MRRLLRLLLASTILAQGTGLQAQPRQARRTAPPRAPSAAPPSPLAELRGMVLPHMIFRGEPPAPRPGVPYILHVQDLHDAEEAQKRLSGLLRDLSARPGGRLLVGLEGASGAFNTEAFRACLGDDENHPLADAVTRLGYLGGAEHAALTAKAPPLLWGIEDPALYHANVRAVRRAAVRREEARRVLARAARWMDDLKAQAYSPALAAYDRRAADHRAGRLGLGEYVSYLASVPGAGPPGRQAALYLSALRREASVDLSAARRDRDRLVERLASALPQQELTPLLEEALEVRDGRASAADHHRRLLALARDRDVPVPSALETYAAYLAEAESVDPSALGAEVDALAERALKALAASPQEKALADLDRRLGVLDRLSLHAMSPADWAFHQARPAEVRAAPEEVRRLCGRPGPPVPPPSFWKPFEDFCRLAEARNEAMAERLLSKMAETGEGKIDGLRRNGLEGAAVLVAGGFHSDGLVSALRRRGADCAVLTPRMSGDLPEGSSLDVFVRRPTPLERILAGRTDALAAERLTADAVPAPARSRAKTLRGLLAAAPPLMDLRRRIREEGLFRRSPEEARRTAQEAFARAGELARSIGVEAFEARLEEEFSRRGFFDAADFVLTHADSARTRVRLALAPQEKRGEALAQLGVPDQELPLPAAEAVLFIHKTPLPRERARRAFPALFRHAPLAAALLAASCGGSLKNRPQDGQAPKPASMDAGTPLPGPRDAAPSNAEAGTPPGATTSQRRPVDTSVISPERRGAYIFAEGFSQPLSKWTQDVDNAKALGISTLRFNSDIWTPLDARSPGADAAWRKLDEMISYANRQGMDILFTLPISNNHNTSNPTGALFFDQVPVGPTHFPARDQREVRAFYTELVRRYNGDQGSKGFVRFWEVWNEPDFGSFWKAEKKPDPAEYLPFVQAASEVVAAESPRAWLIMGGLAKPDLVKPAAAGLPEGLRNEGWLERFAALGGLRLVHAMNIHVYETFATLPGALDYARRVAPGLPIFITEMGTTGARYDTPNIPVRQQQYNHARNHVETRVAALSEKDVLMEFRYLRNPAGMLDLGIANYDGTPKEFIHDFDAHLSRRLEGARALGPVRMGFPNLKVYQFEVDRAGVPTSVFAAWTDGPGEVRVTLPVRSATVFSADGKVTRTVTGAQGNAELVMGVTPLLAAHQGVTGQERELIYVEFPTPRTGASLPPARPFQWKAPFGGGVFDLFFPPFAPGLGFLAKSAAPAAAAAWRAPAEKARVKDLVASALSPAMKSLPPAPPALLVGSNEDFIAQAERELAGLAPREVPGFLSRLLPEARRRELLGGGDLVERVATLVTARAASKDPARTERALAGMVREARAAVTGLDAAFTGAAAAVRIDPLFGGDAAARARVEACLRAWSASASAPPLVLAVGDASVDRPSAERAVRGLLGPGAERAVLLLQKEAPLARDGRLLHDRVEAAARLPLGTLFGVSKGDWDREDLLNLLLPGALVLRAGESLDRAIREFTATLTFA